MQKHYGKKRKYRDQVKIVISSNIVLGVEFWYLLLSKKEKFQC